MRILIAFILFIWLITGYIKSHGESVYLFGFTIILFLLDYEENFHMILFFSVILFILSIIGFVFSRGMDRFASLASFFVFSFTAYKIIRNGDVINLKKANKVSSIERYERYIETSKERQDFMKLKIVALERYMRNLEYMRVFASQLLNAESIEEVKDIVERELMLLGRSGFFKIDNAGDEFTGISVIENKRYAISSKKFGDLKLEVGILATDENSLRLASTILDISSLAVENVLLIERERSLSIHDALTGLFNRREIERILKDAFERYSGRGNLSIAMIDIDDFKKINDTYGHQSGDTVLKVVADIISRNTRETDFVGRYGGEEFLIVFTSTDITNALNVLEKLRKKIADERIKIDDTYVRVTVSAGVSMLGNHSSYIEFLRDADSALYKAKNTGKNRVCTV